MEKDGYCKIYMIVFFEVEVEVEDEDEVEDEAEVGGRR